MSTSIDRVPRSRQLTSQWCWTTLRVVITAGRSLPPGHSLRPGPGLEHRRYRPRQVRLLPNCHHGSALVAETFDDIFEIDGRHDEIYVAAAAYVGGKFVRIGKTAVHGDVGQPNGSSRLELRHSRNGRVKAGTASATTGGIQTGDMVPDGMNPNAMGVVIPPGSMTFPFVAWEGWMGLGHEGDFESVGLGSGNGYSHS